MATSLRAHVDDPVPATPVDPLCFFVRGWVWREAEQASIAAVEAWAGEVLVGSTRLLYERPDVAAALEVAGPVRAGFEFYAHHPGAVAGQPFELEVRTLMRDGSRSAPLFTLTVGTIGRDYRQHHFGILLDRTTTATQRRGNVFAEGPPQAVGSATVDHLLRRHLPAPPARVIDVGCGIGSYGRGLLAEGYRWMGVEVNPLCCAELARLGLPHRQVDGRGLPFADGEFDAALLLEVLEHIDEPRAFLAEVSRVAPRQLLVSVPNCELLSYLCDYAATPWHMLEADHKNFFTRWSLGALLQERYRHVEVGFHTPHPLRTVEGTPLHNHLFAIAWSPA